MSARAVNKLLIDLRDKLKPSKEDKKYYGKIKKYKYKNTTDVWECDALEGIPVKNFEEYLEKLQETHSLSDKVKKSFQDAMISNEKHGSPNDFNVSEEGEVTMFSLEYIVTKRNEKIDLAFAMYKLSFKISEEETSSDKKTFSISDGEKKAFRKYYQKELFNHVDQKCKSK